VISPIRVSNVARVHGSSRVDRAAGGLG